MTRIQDNLFEAVNADWLATVEIPSDKPRMSAFDELVLEIEKNLTSDLTELSVNLPKENKELLEAIKFYLKAGDWAKRNADDFSAVKKELQKISDLKDFETFKAQAGDLILHSQAAMPFGLAVESDMMDAIHHALVLTGPGLILPDTTYYADEHPRKAELLDFWAENSAEILAAFGFEDAEKIAADAVTFDKLLAPFSNTSEEWAKYAELYHPVSADSFLSTASSLDFKAIIETLVGTMPDKIIVFEERFYENFNQIVSPENWNLIKAWMLTKAARKATNYLSEDLRVKGSAYSRKVSNVAEARKQDKHQLDVTESYFSQVIGLFYGKKYFGDEAKADVKNMTDKMIKVYQDRLRTNAWLSEATRLKAIEKLDAITVNIAYPDQLPEYYSRLKTGTGSLYEDVVSFDEILTARHYEKFSQEVDKKEWQMPAHMVNAYYTSDSNSIFFPAAILQAPFYSLTQSKSQNYGGIGAVIAHEISHAFDNNGAQFDKDGNLNKWWSEADYAAFEKKQEEMIAEFDGVETVAGPANGKLIVSENIADQGGITAALTAAQSEDDVNLVDFFEQWARIWRNKASLEFQQMLLSMDVHAPAALRANIPPTNLEEFYETFGIVSTDKMYRAPENRVKIW
ncbi:MULTISPECIES: M13-type metalloendopeptidase [unclassified Lactococcus]|uniref:endopeptidase PepO n=1 Tax=unclassified Lactococcus TaxID=2643510 RepID=UPI0011CC4642|nr:MULTISPECIES: M13-type metalloendopeptidase [unclassified Lactococcus]MQW22110.1 peptidase M13 [Lactococcus sp. dk101]TXK45050.1 peptidase M13 [Lactococcus sp. dk310]TXK51170.1 peptidase M13 [Lactococcus sp. dk322]